MCSLPEKTSNSLEVPKFRSSSSNATTIPHSLSSTSLSRFASEPIQSSQPNSMFIGDGESPKSDKSEGDSKKESKSTKNSATSNNGHFHFSIYKWRSKGVPLDIPLRGKASRSKHVAQSQPSNKTTPLDESVELFLEKQAPDVIKDEPGTEKKNMYGLNILISDDILVIIFLEQIQNSQRVRAKQRRNSQA